MVRLSRDWRGGERKEELENRPKTYENHEQERGRWEPQRGLVHTGNRMLRGPESQSVNIKGSPVGTAHPASGRVP